MIRKFSKTTAKGVYRWLSFARPEIEKDPKIDKLEIPLDRLNNLFKHVENKSIISNFAFGNFTPELLRTPNLIVPEQRLLNLIKKIENEDLDGGGYLTRSQLQNLGLYGAIIPSEYKGGLGLSLSEFCYLMQHPRIIPHALSLIAHQSLCAMTILYYGTKNQKKNYLPLMASGKLIGGFCLTEKSSGSDVFAMETFAAKSPTANAFQMTGSKNWVTNGNIAQLFIVISLTMDSKHEKSPHRLTAFIVDKSNPGITVVANYSHLPQLEHAYLSDVHFDEVFLNENSILYEVNGGYKIANFIQNNARCPISAVQAGLCRQLVELLPSNKHKSTSYTYIDFAHSYLYGLESAIYFTTRFSDQFVMPQIELESTILKIFANETVAFLNKVPMELLPNKSDRHKYLQLQQFLELIQSFLGSDFLIKIFLGGTFMRINRKAFQRYLSHQERTWRQLLDDNDVNPKIQIQWAAAATREFSSDRVMIDQMTSRQMIQLYAKLYRIRTTLTNGYRSFDTKLENYQHIMYYTGRIIAHIYVALTGLARANTTNGHYEIECNKIIGEYLKGDIDKDLFSLTEIYTESRYLLNQVLFKDCLSANGYLARDLYK